MTKPPGTQVVPSAAAVKQGGRLLSPARYRHPGGTMSGAACIELTVALAGRTSSGGHVASGGGNPAGRYGVAITVGSFNFAEGVLPAEIYRQALAAHNHPVRILPNLGTRGPADPALMIGLRQLVPKYAGPAEAWLRGQGLMQAGGVGR